MADKLLKTLNFGTGDLYHPAPDAANVTQDSTHRFVTDAEKTAWNGKADVADIPTVPTKVSAFQNDAGYLTEHQDISKKADLGSDGKVPAAQLPSYVDDVLEAASKDAFPTTGESGKIYVDQATNKTYRWSGSAYVEISASLALGETSSTAYAGDKGKATTEKVDAHVANTDIHVTADQKATWDDHIDDTTKHITAAERTAWNAKSDFSGSYNDLTDKPAGYTHPTYTPKAAGMYKVTVDGTGHVSAAVAVTKDDITGLGIPAQDTVYTHPDSHPASMITQDSTHRMVSDTQISTWNGKADVADIPTALNVVDDGEGNLTITL